MRRRLMLKNATDTNLDNVDGYVKNGIVLWFDAIRNTRTGHSNQALKWDDLSDYQNDLTYNDGSISDKYYVPGSTSLRLDRDISYATFAFAEIVYATNVNGAAGLFYSFDTVVGGTIYKRKTNKISFSSYKDTTRSMLLSLDGNPHYYNSELMKDGQIESNQNDSTSWLISRGYLFGYPTNQYVPDGKIYAVRIYDRVLSTQEQLKNFNEDRQRFGIEVI